MSQFRFIIHVISITIILFFFNSIDALSAVKEYELIIAYQDVNFTGRTVRAMTINGSIPGPTLKFKKGDIAKIHVRNEMDVETSIHWHGILLPNFQDGVPYVTTPPIMPSTAFTYEFPIIHSGTYWYHSHTGLQEQRGVFGSIVIEPEISTVKADIDHVVVVSDWTDENPDEVLRTLKSGNEYYALKKGSVQSIAGAIRADALQDVFRRSWMRMPPMDIADIAYDRFLTNGKPEASLDAGPGQTVKLRIINASASTYFYIQYAGGHMKVISSDGVDIEPISMDRFLIAVAETYDVIITLPGDHSYEFRATAQDGSGHTSLYIGKGHRMSAPDVSKPDLYKMHGNGHGGPGGTMKNMGHGSGGNMRDMDHGSDGNMTGMSHGMDSEMKTVTHGSDREMESMGHGSAEMKMTMDERSGTPYAQLKARASTALKKDLPLREIRLELTGDMERYVWSINGKTLNEADVIRIKKGENVRFIMVNRTMMHHPMHLHGHFFRVVNRHGDYSPLKHTFDVPPMGKQVIEFYANEEKDWFFHCHMLYHMKSGMARIVHYESTELDSRIASIRPNLFKEHWYAWANASILTQMTEGQIVAANTRNTLRATWEAGWDEDYEVVFTFERYFNRFFQMYAGGVLTDGEQDHRGVIGIRYLLPLLFESSAWVDTDGDFRFMVDKEVQLTDRLHVYGEIQYDTESDEEWLGGAAWTLSKSFSILALYHSEYEWGLGLNISY